MLRSETAICNQALRMILGSLGSQQLLLILALDDVGQDQYCQDKVESRLGHRFDMVAKQVQMSQMAPFTDQHDADDEQDEQPRTSYIRFFSRNVET